ncbi:MAG TPA: T9SS type A sorting domain-containing protein [Bacteroidales bacterium]|nr:T9SS type A sorting domain-containing protein [Bacteroidales bacterium]
MKKIFSLLTACVLFTSVLAQTNVLTYEKNAPRVGDSIQVYEVVYMNPGPAGANKIWDFSNLTYTSAARTDHLYAQPTSYLPGVGLYNAVTSENGNECYYNVTPAYTELKGYTNSDISLVYTDAITKMKYPFAYGNTFTDNFSGDAIYKIYSEVTFFGTYTVTADGFGKLYLPGRRLNNVLRIKIHKVHEETHPCARVENDQTIYMWYAKGYRYPILVMSSNTFQNDVQAQVVTNTGLYSPQTTLAKEDLASLDETTDNSFAVSTYPNPFEDLMNCTYFLKKPAAVTIELYDVSGKLSVFIMEDQAQAEGMHSFDIDAVAYGLVPGVYYLRFIFDNKVHVQKIVKI